jgi:hypothetical protein
MTPDEIAAAVKPLRFWLTHSGWGARGDRARRHLDAFEGELNGTRRKVAPCPVCDCTWGVESHGEEHR